MEDSIDFPIAVREQVENFHLNLTNLITILDPILKNYHQLKKVASEDADNLASLELTICYTINSLYWMYLQANGVNGKQHPIKGELERIKLYFNRLKEIKDSDQRPKLNKNASKAFVRNALFDTKNREKNLKHNQNKRFKKN